MFFQASKLLPFVLLGFFACKGESRNIGSHTRDSGPGPDDASTIPPDDADTSLPICTSSNPQHGLNVLFLLNLAPDAGAPAPDGAGGAGPAASGCAYDPQYTTTCTGTARAATFESQLAFIFGDGSTLTWSGTPEQNVSPPAVVDGDTVWIDYEEFVLPRCGFCGTFVRHTISILESEGGEPLLVAMDELEDDPSAETLEALLGVRARAEPSCRTSPYGFDCWELTSDVFDHVLETTPEQLVPYRTRTLVQTPRGTFELTWSTATHSSTTPIERCSDGPSPRNIRDFAATRVVF